MRLTLDLSRQSQRWLGLYERETYAWLERFSRGIRTGIDIGANEGLHTSFFLLKTSAQRVWSFDGDPAMDFFPKCVGSDEDADTCSLDSIYGDLELPCLVKMDVDGV